MEGKLHIYYIKEKMHKISKKYLWKKKKVWPPYLLMQFNIAKVLLYLWVSNFVCKTFEKNEHGKCY